MTQPISEQIIDNIQTTLQAMTDATYNYNIGDVRRVEDRGVKQFYIKFPAVGILYNSQTKENTNDQKRRCEMSITLKVYTTARENVEQHLNILSADIEKALGVDYTRNNLAIDSNVDGDQISYVNPKEGTGPTGIIDIDLTISYRHANNQGKSDPFNA